MKRRQLKNGLALVAGGYLLLLGVVGLRDELTDTGDRLERLEERVRRDELAYNKEHLAQAEELERAGVLERVDDVHSPLGYRFQAKAPGGPS